MENIAQNIRERVAWFSGILQEGERNPRVVAETATLMLSYMLGLADALGTPADKLEQKRGKK